MLCEFLLKKLPIKIFYSHFVSGAITRLSELLERPVLWLLCLHHVLELIYGDACKVFFATEGPKDSLYARLEKFWATLSDEDLEDIKKEAFEKRREVAPDDELTDEFAERILALLSFLFSLDHGFQRGDYLGLARLIQVSMICV